MMIVLMSSVIFFYSCSESSAKPTYMPSAKAIKIQTYKFGIHPYLNSKKMYASYRPILDLLEKKIGNIEIDLETSSNYAQYNKKLYRGDFDFSLPNPYQTYKALAYDYKVIARMKPDSLFRGIFVGRKDSHLTSVNQLKGQKVSFPAPTALAATMMPLMYLHNQGLDVKNDINMKYVGSQHSSILNAYVSQTIVGATWPTAWLLWKKENPEKEKEMEIVWQTESLINNGMIVKKDLDPVLIEKVKNILLRLDMTPRGQELLTNAGFEGFQDSNDTDFDVVSNFLITYDKAIGLPK